MAARKSRSASGRSNGLEVEEWRMARDWMINTGVLSVHSRVTDPSLTLFDFAQSLRDGVLLCQSANVLSPNAVKVISMNQMSQFRCMQNIRSFLTACSRHFNLENDDLFDANDLYDVSDFGKVVHTLSVLSHLPVAVQMGLEPFSPDSSKFMDYQDEDIYSNLEEIALSRDITEEENPYDVVTIEDEGDKIYEDLCFPANKLQKPTRQSSQEERRKYIVEEIMETEKGYVEALKMIVQSFIGSPKMKNAISNEDKELIFINIEELFKIHSKFVFKLERACNGETGANISKVFLDSKDEFLKYGNYCARMPDAQAHIDELIRREAKFRDVLEECQKRANSKFALRSLLVVPFQRVLKYPLLISELFKQTKTSHPDKQGLEKALAAVQDVATYINQVKRDDENMKTVRDIQKSLTSEVDVELLRFGHLMKDGEVQVKTSDQTPKKRHAFLFDRALIICKTKGDTYHHKMTLFLKSYELQENITSGPGRGKFLHGWSMRGETAEAERNSCSMFTKTAEMKEKWINEINRAMDNLMLKGIDQGNHRFDLHTFTNPTYCGVCQNLLWGLVNQGYKCASCDAACHQDCISKCKPCRPSSQLLKQFSGISPCLPRNNIGHSPISSGSSSESDKTFRKISAPSRMGLPPFQKQAPLVKQTSSPVPMGDWPPSRPDRLPPTPARHKQNNQVVIAISSFQGVAPSGRPSLHLMVDDEVEVQNQSDPEWWEGFSTRTGSTGYFPRVHVVSQENSEQSRITSEYSAGRLYGTKHNHEVYTEFLPDGLVQSRRYRYEQHALKEEIPENTSPVPDDINNALQEFGWFGGKLVRDAADKLLSDRSDGTFLIRESVNREGQYALSVRFRNACKHIKIPYQDGQFFLTQTKQCDSIPELVEYYRTNTLGVSFPGLDTSLRCGIYEDQDNRVAGMGWVKAVYAYTARNAKEISIQKNSKILILNKDGDWWKGECDGQVGYFPSNYVEPLKE